MIIVVMPQGSKPVLGNGCYLALTAKQAVSVNVLHASATTPGTCPFPMALSLSI